MPHYLEYNAPHPKWLRRRTTRGTWLVTLGLFLAAYGGVGSIFVAGDVRLGKPDSVVGLGILFFSMCVGIAMIVFGVICLSREENPQPRQLLELEKASR